MFQKMMYFSDSMRDHIESFRRHYGITTTSEAIRTLILAGFSAYGNPLVENAQYLHGRPRIDKLGIEQYPPIPAPAELYKKLFNTEEIKEIPLEDFGYDVEEIKQGWEQYNKYKSVSE